MVNDPVSPYMSRDTLMTKIYVWGLSTSSRKHPPPRALFLPKK